MTNRNTHEASHHDAEIDDLLRAFRTARLKTVRRLESLDESDWARSALHPRLKQPMRIVDIVYFDSEHDDYHLARIGELIHAFTYTSSGDRASQHDEASPVPHSTTKAQREGSSVISEAFSVFGRASRPQTTDY